MNIKVLTTLKNYTIIKDSITGFLYCYSYQELIAYYDDKIHYNKNKLTDMSKMHLSWFKKYLDNITN